MAGRAVANRSEPITVPTPRGPVEVVRQQWHSQRAGSRWQWEWLARRGGQRDWKQGSTAREAIRQATELPEYVELGGDLSATYIYVANSQRMASHRLL